MGREDIVKSIQIRIYIVLPLYSFLSSLSSFSSIQSTPYSIESVRIISIGIRANFCNHDRNSIRSCSHRKIQCFV